MPPAPDRSGRPALVRIPDSGRTSREVRKVPTAETRVRRYRGQFCTRSGPRLGKGSRRPRVPQESATGIRTPIPLGTGLFRLGVISVDLTASWYVRFTLCLRRHPRHFCYHPGRARLVFFRGKSSRIGAYKAIRVDGCGVAGLYARLHRFSVIGLERIQKLRRGIAFSAIFCSRRRRFVAASYPTDDGNDDHG
jgi:hypothetical protein